MLRTVRVNYDRVLVNCDQEHQQSSSPDALTAEVFHFNDDVCDTSSKPKKRPVVVVVHGGAWMTFSNMSQMCFKLCETLDCTCFSPRYSLSSIDSIFLKVTLLVELFALLVILFVTNHRTGKSVVIMALAFAIVLGVSKLIQANDKLTHHPTHINDLARSLLWVVNNIKVYGGDPDNIHIVGHSAGGHLCSLLALNDRYLNQFNLSQTVIKSVVSICGPHSLRRLRESFVVNMVLTTSIFKTPDGLTEMQRRLFEFECCPLSNVPCDKNTKYVPPFLILYAEMDASLQDHANDLHCALTQAGCFSRIVRVEGTTHFTIRRGWDNENAATLFAVTQFLHETMLMN